MFADKRSQISGFDDQKVAAPVSLAFMHLNIGCHRLLPKFVRDLFLDKVASLYAHFLLNPSWYTDTIFNVQYIGLFIRAFSEPDVEWSAAIPEGYYSA